jgi:hypothetical protein
MPFYDPVILLAITPTPALVAIAWGSIGIAGGCALLITADIIAGRHQHMAIMNVVWPLTALYGGILALIAYLAFGRAMKMEGPMKQRGMKHDRPMWQSTFLGATHCGAGCMAGDVLTDGALFLLGASTLLGSALLTSYVFDFVAAYLLGIVFQYFAIVPMRHLSPGEGIVAAIKADTLSLIAFQVGMYAWMAIYQKLLFHPSLEADSPVFWLMMQIGMIAGFATAYPMNWCLIRAGAKEKM